MEVPLTVKVDRQHPKQPPKDLALQLAVSAREVGEQPDTTVKRAKAYADFLADDEVTATDQPSE